MHWPRARVTVAALAAAAVVCAGVVWSRELTRPPGTVRATCLLGSPQLHTATEQTLAGLDGGIFTSFRVLEPPPPPLRSDRYRGPLWTYATLTGSRDLPTVDLSGEWEAELAQGVIAERCSLGLTDLQQAVAGGTVRYASGRPRLAGGGAGYFRAGRVLGAQASGESDAQIIAKARRVLAEYGLAPRAVRVLHPLGPALLVQASAADVSSVEGRVPQLENALDGSDWGKHPRLEGVYLAVDGPDGPLVRIGGATRAASGFGWVRPGFDSGIQHG